MTDFTTTVVVGRGTHGDIYYNVTGTDPEQVLKEWQALDSVLNPEPTGGHHNVLKFLELIEDFSSPPNMTTLKDSMRGRDNSGKHKFILAMEEEGYIVRRQGRGRTMYVEVTDKGLKLLSEGR